MKKVLLLSIAIFGATQSAFASKKSGLTETLESLSSSSYSKQECSMEDYTCQDLILDAGRQEALSRYLSGDKGEMSVVLQQAIAIERMQNEDVKDLSDEQIVEILRQQ